MLLQLLMAVAVAQTLSLEGLEAPAGVSESAAKGWLAAQLTTLEACTLELLPEAGEPDTRARIDLRLGCTGGRRASANSVSVSRVQGGLVLASGCVEDVVARWSTAPVSSTECGELVARLRAAYEPKRLAAAWDQHRADAATVCEAFERRLARAGALTAKTADQHFAIIRLALGDFAAARGRRPDSTKEGGLVTALQSLPMTRDVRGLLVATARAMPADQGQLLWTGYTAELGLPGWCPRMGTWVDALAKALNPADRRQTSKD